MYSSISSMIEFATSGSVCNSIRAIDVVSKSSGYSAVVNGGFPFNKISEIQLKVWYDDDHSHQ